MKGSSEKAEGPERELTTHHQYESRQPPARRVSCCCPVTGLPGP